MATTETRQMIALLMKGDPTIEATTRSEVLRLIDGKAVAALDDKLPPDRALSRQQVAQLMGIAPRTVTLYAQRGVIKPLRYGACGIRAMGYSERSVREAMLRGCAAVAVGA